MINLIEKFSNWIADKIFDTLLEEKIEENDIPDNIDRDEEYFDKYFKCKDEMSLSYKQQEKLMRKNKSKINKLKLQLIKN